MEARLIRRPAISNLSSLGQCLLVLNSAPRRHESSYRRSKKRLNVKPDDSFLLSNQSPRQDHIIFNPPSAAPSVLHTPLKFLPKEDKRKQALQAHLTKLNQTSPRAGFLPAPVKRKTKVPHHHLSDADIAEIQRLKRTEPDAWSNLKLARKFNCSSMFISICLSQCGHDDSAWQQKEKERLEAIKERWGPRKRMAREDKQRRLEIALRDE
jgi:hypothetical protein